MNKQEIEALSGVELREQANVLGIKFAANAGDRVVKDKILGLLNIESDSVSDKKDTAQTKDHEKKSQSLSLRIAQINSLLRLD